VSNDVSVDLELKPVNCLQSVEDGSTPPIWARSPSGFTESAVARFADFQEMHGRSAIMAFLTRVRADPGYRRSDIAGADRKPPGQHVGTPPGPTPKTGKSMLGRAPRSGSCRRQMTFGTPHQRLGKRRTTRHTMVDQDQGEASMKVGFIGVGMMGGVCLTCKKAATKWCERPHPQARPPPQRRRHLG